MQLLLLLTVPSITWIAWTAVSLFNNYQTAKKIGLPVVVSPVSSLSPLWIITYKILLPSTIALLQALPVGTWPRCTYMGWQFDDKYQLHARLGPAFVLCTPSLNEVIIADADTAHHVLVKRKDFIKPSIMYDGLNVFGKNLDSVEGEMWQRHRRVTAPNFNERVSSSVWSESIRQARQMLTEWTKVDSAKGTRDVVQDTASLALNVLTYAGFGLRYDFKELKSKIEPPHMMSYRDALGLVLRNFTLLVILPMNFLTARYLPQSIRAVGKACEEFKLYMQETVDRERAAVTKGDRTEGDAQNLLSALVRASQAEDRGLSDDEIYGNIFIYNMAGHESTANALATSIAYLASSPKWQDWIRDEIEEVMGNNDSTTDDNEQTLSYETTYPNLKRCQAIMLETLRLHGSVVFLPKATTTTQPLSINGQTHTIPPGTFVVINSQAIHCNSTVWDDDALLWRPDRWITTSSTSQIQQEELISPAPGTFLGWADGPRICPGKKFSQVEFTGVMATLFRRHGVRPVREKSESEKDVYGRVKRMIEDSGITAITLQMKRPREVALVWERVV